MPLISFRDAALENQLNRLIRRGSSRGQMARELLKRHFQILAAELKSLSLTPDELEMVRAAAEGQVFPATAAPLLPFLVIGDGQDAARMALGNKLLSCSTAQLWALVDWAEQENIKKRAEQP